MLRRRDNVQDRGRQRRDHQSQTEPGDREVGVEPGTPATALPRVPGLRARAEELTRQCLATPWDYPLLGCLQTRGSEQLCLARFQRRRALGGGDPNVE